MVIASGVSISPLKELTLEMKNATKIYLRALFHAVVFVVLVGATTHAAELQNYKVDSKDSSVSFSVKHIVVSEVRGRFKQFSGTIKFDEANLPNSSVAFTVETASVDTGNERRDSDLRGPMFLEVTKYPEMSFVSRRIERSGHDYVLIGNLNLHGTTREIRVPFVYNGKVKDTMGKLRIAFSATFTINRQEWGINYNKVLDNGGLVAGNEVTVQLDVVAAEQQQPIPARIDTIR
jgi:polyisoprenoid-binding protein YceI